MSDPGLGPRAARMRIDALVTAHRFDEACEIAAIAIAQHPDDWQLLTAAAIAHHHAGHHVDASKLIAGAVRRAPDTEWPLRVASLVAEGYGDKEGAFDYARRALALDPTNRAVLIRYAYASYNGQRFLGPFGRREAARAAELVLETDPRSSSALRILGLTEILDGKRRKGMRHLEAAVEADPLDTEAQLALAQLLHRRGRHRRSAAVLQGTVDLTPTDGRVHLALLRALSGEMRLGPPLPLLAAGAVGIGAGLLGPHHAPWFAVITTWILVAIAVGLTVDRVRRRRRPGDPLGSVDPDPTWVRAIRVTCWAAVAALSVIAGLGGRTFLAWIGCGYTVAALVLARLDWEVFGLDDLPYIDRNAVLSERADRELRAWTWWIVARGEGSAQARQTVRFVRGLVIVVVIINGLLSASPRSQDPTLRYPWSGPGPTELVPTEAMPCDPTEPQDRASIDDAVDAYRQAHPAGPFTESAVAVFAHRNGGWTYFDIMLNGAVVDVLPEPCR